MSESTLLIHTLPAFTDNYIWLLANQAKTIVVDPGNADVVLASLAQLGAQLEAILVTHHHADHIGGVAAIISHHPHVKVFVPRHSPLLQLPCVASAPGLVQAVGHGERLDVAGLGFEVFETPGHTRDHVAYFMPSNASNPPRLFCGDTLFSVGCGRVFDGTVQQLWHSLQALASLPAQTLVYCAHEYTEANVRFAQAVQPHNPQLEAYAQSCRRQRAQQLPTVPFELGLQRYINPFLRTQAPDVVRAAERFLARAATDEIEVFAALRAWKNQFQA